MPTVYVIVEDTTLTDTTIASRPTNLRVWKVQADDVADIKPKVKQLLREHRNQIDTRAIVALESDCKVMEMRGSLVDIEPETP